MNLGFGKNYLISLDRHKLRRENALQILGEENTILIEGIDGENYIGNEKWLNNHLAPTVIDPKGWWSISKICNGLSHKKAWATFLDSGDETACFFEDDIIINDRFNYETIEEIRDGLEAKENWGCVFLGKERNTIKLVDDVSYFALHSSNGWGGYKRFLDEQWSAHAYILNKKAAKWLFENQGVINKAVEVYLEFMPFDIYAPRFSHFNIKRYTYSANDGRASFMDVIKDSPDSQIIPPLSSEEKSFSFPRYNSSFKGYKLTF
ncbi:MAG: glycosyltransferase family 25 protein [Bacteroidetes bacterium]|jgi:GR25 family glycosyltransferase involved in LPS biosynthesis|nr:glycosyltransferase family 25 protein [Bacteroidota bacterium]